jgi:hypothetical protein
MANKNNPVVKAMLCLTSYLLACLERCIKFITKNAYIQVTINCLKLKIDCIDEQKLL